MTQPARILPRLALLAALPLAAVASTAEAADKSCTPGKVVSYDKPASFPKFDTRCDFEKGNCKRIDLKGYLYMPEPADLPPDAKGKAPILVYNHGSGENGDIACEIGRWFAKRGVAVFAPQRRGHSVSTGIYLTEYSDFYCSNPVDKEGCKIEYVHKQVADVKAAIAFMKKQPGIDGAKLAIMGHSYGGIVTTFTNTFDLGQRAVIDFAGASQSWGRTEDEGNAVARADMLKAVQNAVAPIYFFEPLNDASIEPTLELARAAGHRCRQFQSAIFPAVDTDRDDDDDKITAADYSSERDAKGNHARDRAHSYSARMVGKWGPSVLEFMTRYFAHPAKPFDLLCKNSSIAAGH